MSRNAIGHFSLLEEMSFLSLLTQSQKLGHRERLVTLGALWEAAGDSWHCLRRASVLIILVFVMVNTFKVKINFPFGLPMILFLML